MCLSSTKTCSGNQKGKEPWNSSICDKVIMKIILIKDLPKLGKKGDTVIVKNGYARNYLIPKGIALEATESNIKHFYEIEKQKKAKKEREKTKAEKIKEKIDGEGIKLKLRISEEGKAFGAITSSDIAEALNQKKKVEINHHSIELEKPIKEKGKYEITINLYPGIKAKINLWVVEGKK